MSDKILLQSIREICNSAVNSCSMFYTDNSIGQKQLALRILDKLNEEDTDK